MYTSIIIPLICLTCLSLVSPVNAKSSDFAARLGKNKLYKRQGHYPPGSQPGPAGLGGVFDLSSIVFPAPPKVPALPGVPGLSSVFASDNDES